MARSLMLAQRCPYGPEKMMMKTTFTQKKKLWEAMAKVVDPTTLILKDDVSGKEIQASYNGLCEKLRRAGRALLCEPDGRRLFLIVDAVTNEMREWDVDVDGKPIYNPLPEKDGESEQEASS